MPRKRSIGSSEGRRQGCRRPVVDRVAGGLDRALDSFGIADADEVGTLGDGLLGDYIATRQAALEDQRNRDDDGQNRESQAAAPRASAAIIGTIGHEFRTGTAPRFDFAPVRVGYLPGDGQSNRSTIELSSRFSSRVRWRSLPAKMVPARRLSSATLDHQAPRSPGRWTAKCGPGVLRVGLDTPGRRRRRLRRWPPPRCPVPVAASLLAELVD